MQLPFLAEVHEVVVSEMLSLISSLIAGKSTFKVYGRTFKVSNWVLPAIDC